MSQIRALYRAVGQDDKRPSRASVLPRKSNANRLSAARGSVRSIANARQASPRPSKKAPLISEKVQFEEATNASSDEDSGSEDWDTGGMRSSVIDTQEAALSEEDEPLAPRLKRQSLRPESFVDRLKAKRTTKSLFGFHVNLAFKVAIFVVLGNLAMLVHPLQTMIPEQFWPVLGYVGLYVVFSIWKNLGDTIAYSFQGIAGALLGTLNVIATTTAIGGTTPTSNLQFCFVWLHFVAYIGLVLWLNFDGNTRNFALCTHVSYFMLVLKPEDPNSEKNLLRSLTMEEFWKYPTEVVNLTVSVAGALLALLAAALPLVPVLPSTYVYKVGDALRYAEEEVEDLTQAMGQLVMHAVDGFKANSQSLVVDSFIAQAEHMHVRIQKLDSLVDAAWWEVIFPCSSHRRLRLRVVKDMHEILIGVLDNVIILLHTLKYEDFQKSHVEMMDEIEVPLEDLATFFAEELNKALQTLLHAQYGHVLPDRRKILQTKKDYINELGKAYMRTLEDIIAEREESAEEAAEGDAHDGRRSRASTLSSSSGSQPGGPRQTQQNEVLHETMEESHFVYRLILMTDRLITRLERQEPLPEDQQSRCGLVAMLVRHLTNPDVLFRPDHVTFAIRQSITIVASFVVCMRYYHYSATMAITQALLVNEGTFTGSMLKKNLGRLQGVVIGTIFPHLFFDWFSECSFVYEFTLALILFFFEWISLYVYFSSEDFGYFGCLVGAFGASAMCQGCGLKPNTMKSLYLVMEQNAVGIALLTFVDLIFAPERASDLATRWMSYEPSATGQRQNDVMGILPLLQYGLATSLEVDMKTEERSTGHRAAQVVQPDRLGEWNMKSIGQLRQALQLCDEAYAEPRYMRRPWPYKLFADVVMVCQGLRVDIIALSDAVGVQAASHREHGVFTNNQEFRRFCRKLVKAFNCVSHMVRLALKHFDEESGEQGEPFHKRIREGLEHLKIPTDEDIERLSRELLDRPEFLEARNNPERRRLSVRSHVLTDTFCRTSVAVCVLKNVTRRLQKLHASVVDCV